MVSTVGGFQRLIFERGITEFMGKDTFFKRLGPDRYFETMAFMAKDNDKFNDADVSKQVIFDSNWQLDDPDAEIEANEMHDAVVKEISRDLLSNKLRIELI